MNNTADDSARAASIIQTLCFAEGRDVVFRFGEPISVPTGKYDGRSYQSDTLPKATLNATIQHARVEDPEGALMCFAEVGLDELDRVGINLSVVYTEPVGESPDYSMVEVWASREWVDEAPELSNEEMEQAIEEGRQEEVLPPWDGLPTVVVNVERTQECHERSYNSNFHIQYSSPTHEIGELIDVRIK
ncbi:hypothetical protein [Halomarina rubra]|uniref:Uncharacterized protein n=1 Tax=Halomarina rubra TaxID=2071873 RepID=A0ABD6AV80_9EURY|nr:hypothetical protein [Halomarina rubra]